MSKHYTEIAQEVYEQIIDSIMEDGIDSDDGDGVYVQGVEVREYVAGTALGLYHFLKTTGVLDDEASLFEVTNVINQEYNHRLLEEQEEGDV